MTIINLAAMRRTRAELGALVMRCPHLTETEARERLAVYLREPRKDNPVTLSAAVFIRLAPEDIERLDALASKLPIASRNAIARAAMRLGLDAIERDPARALVAGPVASSPKRVKKAR